MEDSSLSRSLLFLKKGQGKQQSILLSVFFFQQNCVEIYMIRFTTFFRENWQLSLSSFQEKTTVICELGLIQRQSTEALELMIRTRMRKSKYSRVSNIQVRQYKLQLISFSANY